MAIKYPTEGGGKEGKEGKGASPIEWVAVEEINAAITNSPGLAGEVSPLTVGTDTQGITYLRGGGKVSAAGIAGKGKLFKLPEGHRPARIRLGLFGFESTLSVVFAIEVLESGEVKLTNSAVEANAKIGFDGVNFPHT